jgi:hypothetical protein
MNQSLLEIMRAAASCLKQAESAPQNQNNVSAKTSMKSLNP